MTTPTKTDEHEHHAVEIEREGLFVHFGRQRVRLEFLLLAGIVALGMALGVTVLALDLGQDDVERWGYFGLFGIVLLRSASVVFPVPAPGIIFGAGGLLDPVGGVPAPIAVGIVAGFAESIGEFTGYAAGYSGSPMLERQSIYRRVQGWIERRPFLTVFALSFTPGPFFDVAGLAAGATRVPIRVFYPPMLAGKIIRDTIVATLGFYSVNLVGDVLSWIWGVVEDTLSSLWGVVEGVF
jgi:membrane protein DedA with SNARE-associated domain